MKRNIMCLKCGAVPLGSFSGEWNYREMGNALKFYHCDLCGLSILKGAPCVAESMGLDQSPHYEWEFEYISKISVKTEPDAYLVKAVKAGDRGFMICDDFLQAEWRNAPEGMCEFWNEPFRRKPGWCDFPFPSHSECPHNGVLSPDDLLAQNVAKQDTQVED